MKAIALLCISSLFINGVFGDPNEVKTLAVMEGDSVTLHTDIIIQSKSVIEWNFGKELVLIARIDREADTVLINDDVAGGRFIGRLKMNNQTGDLTITNVTTNHTEEYQLDITNRKRIKNTFSLRVFGDPGGVKSVSVMEGDFVTLHVGYPDIKNYDVIHWRFQHNSLLAEVNRSAMTFLTHDDVYDGRFRHRLELDDQSGDLSISNMRTEDSGLYEVNVTSNSEMHTVHKTFTVTVSGEKEILSVLEGDSVSLYTHLTDIQRDDEILWKFVSDDTLVAEIDQPKNRFTAYNGSDVRFKTNLNLNHQTGSLTVFKITIKLSGLYELKIMNRRQSVRRRITVNVTKAILSSDVVAGICVGVVVFICVALAGVFYCHHRFPKARTQEVMEGDSVILHTDVNARPDDVEMKWRFGPHKTLIAETETANDRICDDVLDGRFRDRLTLTDTGSLTISDTRTTDSGLYQLKITSNGKTSYKRFRLTVTHSIRENGPLINGDNQHH